MFSILYWQVLGTVSAFMNYQDYSEPNLRTGSEAGDHMLEQGVGR